MKNDAKKLKEYLERISHPLLAEEAYSPGLPPELVIDIARRLDAKSLQALSHTSKRFRSLALAVKEQLKTEKAGKARAKGGEDKPNYCFFRFQYNTIPIPFKEGDTAGKLIKRAIKRNPGNRGFTIGLEHLSMEEKVRQFKFILSGALIPHEEQFRTPGVIVHLIREWKST